MSQLKTPKENRQKSSLKKFYGNKDEKQEYAFKPEFQDHFVIRHSKIEKLSSGAAVEDPNSVYYQFYEVDEFERMYEQKVRRDGVQVPSKFDNLGLTVTILHDPQIIQ